MTTRPEFIAHYQVSDRAKQTLSAHLLTVGTQAARFGGKLGLALPADSGRHGEGSRPRGRVD